MIACSKTKNPTNDHDYAIKIQRCWCGRQVRRNTFKKIINVRFHNNIKGNKYVKSVDSPDGDEGHWVERSMGIPPNAINGPDLFGYECKKYSNKITFGDWQASVYLFNIEKNKKKMIDPASKHAKRMRDVLKNKKITRDEFIGIFGTPNPKKQNRFSWSGTCFPKYGENWNHCGQRMYFDDKGDLVIEYSFINDKRVEKNAFPDYIKKTDKPFPIAFWEKQKLKNHVDNKFGIRGFFVCKKNKQKVYDKICFGPTITFSIWLDAFKNKQIILDSGMKRGNPRNYSSFRASKTFWETLITEEY